MPPDGREGEVMWHTRGRAWEFPAAWTVYICRYVDRGLWGGQLFGGRCMFMCGHTGPERWPEEAEGHLPKARVWSL